MNVNIKSEKGKDNCKLFVNGEIYLEIAINVCYNA